MAANEPTLSQDFVCIFKSIEDSTLIKQLHIPRPISHEIAEFATGEIVHCFNPKCQREILLLQQHKQWACKVSAPDADDEDDDIDISDSDNDAENKQYLIRHLCYLYKDPRTQTNLYAQCIEYEDFDEATYFCDECMNSLQFLCDGARCICRNKASFTAACDKCKGCNQSMTQYCHEKCRRGMAGSWGGCRCAPWREECDLCGDKYCRTSRVCVDMIKVCGKCMKRCCTECCTEYEKPRFNKIVCNECVASYEKHSEEELFGIMRDLYYENMDITKKEMRGQVSEMFHVKPKVLRKDKKYLSAFNGLVDLFQSMQIE
eukprot:CAMPEP_0197044848 /NCGR_PEP_ID=MMETSP1384-20130603/20815_1 /TAXON_ID=29189 /ORGANISM="Ammonia sp." /LENGTH=316 /DNA_ID=CAMNT_0042476367 /DNA_START=63 /DNA_END=1013 /DNA_ORIENTATION=+